MCIENTYGAHAGYDSTFDGGTVQGETAGCPQKMLVGLTAAFEEGETE